MYWSHITSYQSWNVSDTCRVAKYTSDNDEKIDEVIQ